MADIHSPALFFQDQPGRLTLSCAVKIQWYSLYGTLSWPNVSTLLCISSSVIRSCCKSCETAHPTAWPTFRLHWPSSHLGCLVGARSSPLLPWLLTGHNLMKTGHCWLTRSLAIATSNVFCLKTARLPMSSLANSWVRWPIFQPVSMTSYAEMSTQFQCLSRCTNSQQGPFDVLFS